MIGGGAFAAVGAREALDVPGDAAPTMKGHCCQRRALALGNRGPPPLLPAALLSVILYRLFRPVHPTLALLALGLHLCDIAVEWVLLTTLYVLLALFEDGNALHVLDNRQRDVLLPWILVPPFVGELSLAVWLAARGVRVTG